MTFDNNYIASKREKDRMQWIMDMWRSYQCAPCRRGDRSQCTAREDNARAFIERPDGTREYFCFAGCALLRVLEVAGHDGLKKVICQQFDEEGHYEQLRNSIGNKKD
jgi:hypothetical protein